MNDGSNSGSLCVLSGGLHLDPVEYMVGNSCHNDVHGGGFLRGPSFVRGYTVYDTSCCVCGGDCGGGKVI